tara:strand:- start:85 stop:402 length:318 start_codon:yes stop_codon:yes gene_type:complete
LLTLPAGVQTRGVPKSALGPLSRPEADFRASRLGLQRLVQAFLYQRASLFVWANSVQTDVFGTAGKEMAKILLLIVKFHGHFLACLEKLKLKGRFVKFQNVMAPF